MNIDESVIAGLEAYRSAVLLWDGVNETWSARIHTDKYQQGARSTKLGEAIQQVCEELDRKDGPTDKSSY